MKIVLDVERIGRARGIRSGYALQKAAKLAPSVASRAWKGTLTRIDFGVLAKLCETLGVTPGELLHVETD